MGGIRTRRAPPPEADPRWAAAAPRPALFAIAVGLVAGIGACDRAALDDGLPDQLDCSSCHGTAGNPAPPVAVNGSGRTTELGVGAHQAHLNSTLSRPVACTECHVVPTSLANHPDPLVRPAPVLFGILAQTSGAAPLWDRSAATCASTYCHGATLSGAESRAAPVWTRVDGTQKTCTSCHGNPPGGTHPASTACEACHGAVIGAGGVFVNAVLHMDGKVDVGTSNSVHPAGYASPALHGPDTYRSSPDCRLCHGAALEGTATTMGCDPCHQPGWRTNCVYCHGGTLESSGAPPRGLFGATATTELGVGAHTVHVSRTDHPAYACTECHAAVLDVMTPGHLFDATPGTAEVVFAAGRSPAGQYSAPGCSTLYCHGNGRAPGDVASFVPTGTMTCQSCHPTATQSSGHASHASFPCNTCHLDVVADSQTVIAPDLHVDGAVEVRMAAGDWIPSTRTCAGSVCHSTGDIQW